MTTQNNPFLCIFHKAGFCSVNTMYSFGQTPTFQKNMFAPSSGCKWAGYGCDWVR